MDSFCDDYERDPCPAFMYGKREDGSQFSDKLYWSFANDVYNGAEVFPGSFYDLKDNITFDGMCMSPIVSDSVVKKIIGFHIGGVTGTKKGCGFAITRAQLVAARAELYELNTTALAGPQSRDIEDSMMGKEYALSSTVHHKCPTNYITGDPAIVVYGSVTGRSTFNSTVIETPISAIVEKVTGVPNKYGPPRFKDPIKREDGSIDNQTWKPWYASLEVCSKPSVGFDPAKVEVAADDYISGILDMVDRDIALHKAEVKPLSHQETISGITGRRFVDAMVASTSVGYPIGGPKSRFMIDLPPTDEHQCPREFTPEIQAEIARVLTLCDAGDIPNLIFGASLKDEPTKFGLHKVRVFQAAPLALQYALRKYFLPIARVLSLYPLISELAVGVNAHGPEWHELTQFMCKFGEDRILAGDYSKYDLRMPAQLTIAAFSIMIRIARHVGNYSSADIARMEVLAHEVCTPLVAYNGTLIRFLGTNPSGQNLTVYVNSIVNSLLHRICFFEIYPIESMSRIGRELSLGRDATYRDIVATMTYGDDAKGSVRPGFDLFNHISMANILKENDMVFTMPDKTSTPTHYMSRYEADFLKRRDRYEEELGLFVGCLDEDSIFKSLHSILKPTAVTPEEVCAQNIDGALREFFFHGREVFEHRRQQMKQIAEEANLYCLTLDQDFDDRVQAFKEKYEYTPQSGTIESEPDDEGFTIESVAFDASSRSSVSELSAVSQEDTLIASVKSILGSPAYEQYDIISTNFGQGDLLYQFENVYLVIECKRVVGRNGSYRRKVRQQAMKYANVIAILRPDATIYAITYTEYGFEIVDVHGELIFPAVYEEFLDAIPITFS